LRKLVISSLFQCVPICRLNLPTRSLRNFLPRKTNRKRNWRESKEGKRNRSVIIVARKVGY